MSDRGAGVRGRGKGYEQATPDQKGTPITRLTTNTQFSLDGVAHGNGGPDPEGGFERGGLARPLFDSEAMTYVDEVYQSADAFLFGRRTYDLFAGYWGVREDLGNPIV